jgi:hypothetical protein
MKINKTQSESLAVFNQVLIAANVPPMTCELEMMDYGILGGESNELLIMMANYYVNEAKTQKKEVVFQANEVIIFDNIKN